MSQEANRNSSRNTCSGELSSLGGVLGGSFLSSDLVASGKSPDVGGGCRTGILSAEMRSIWVPSSVVTSSSTFGALLPPVVWLSQLEGAWSRERERETGERQKGAYLRALLWGVGAIQHYRWPPIDWLFLQNLGLLEGGIGNTICTLEDKYIFTSVWHFLERERKQNKCFGWSFGG